MLTLLRGLGRCGKRIPSVPSRCGALRTASKPASVRLRRRLFPVGDRPPPLVALVLKPEALREEIRAEFCAACAGYWGKAPVGAKTPQPELNLSVVRSR